MKYLFTIAFTVMILFTFGLSSRGSAITLPEASNFAAGNCATSQSCVDAQQGANEVNNGSGLNVDQLIGTVVSILAWIIGLVAVFMVIFGGFRFVTSGGDSNAVSSARTTIFYALIGLVVSALAQVLVHYVLKSFFPKI